MVFPQDPSQSGFQAILNGAGSLVDDAVTITLGTLSTVYDGWESIRIQRSLEQIAGTFSISMTDQWRSEIGFGEPWPLVPGQSVSVKIGVENVLKGFIDRINSEVESDTRTLSISGRDTTGDLVDSSAPTEPAEYKNVSILVLAQRLAAPFGIPVAADVSVGEAFQSFSIKQGETIFEALHRAAEQRGLLLLTTELGGLLITNRSSALSQIRALAPLVQGGNILGAKATYDYGDRFQTYIVKGQTAGSDVFNKLNVTQPIGTAVDQGISRPRTKTLIPDGSVDFASAQRRANWEAITRAARSVDITIRVQGWRQVEGGPVWRINQLVSLDAQFIGQSAQEFIISGVQFSKSLSEGTITTLKLTRADAYVPEKPLLTAAEDPSQNLGWQAKVFKILGRE